jgi:hypothetical protein
MSCEKKAQVASTKFYRSSGEHGYSFTLWSKMFAACPTISIKQPSLKSHSICRETPVDGPSFLLAFGASRLNSITRQSKKT